MTSELSPNTQAILLLAAPLIAGGSSRKAPCLSAGEYRKLAGFLHRIQAEPADLLGPEADRLIGECRGSIERDRLKSLLNRGFQLAQAVERWRTRAIWVISRADADYPKKLKDRLKTDAPILLYGCGAKEVLHTPGLAIVGSRNVDEPLLNYTHDVASTASKAGRTVISGAAKGVDQAAMRAALEVGGKATGVLAGDLERTTMNREHRNLLLEERLVLISPYDPGARFQVGHAMQRNKTIYALADAGLVVNAEVNKGGTWAGALEQLKKYSSTVYVRSTGNSCDGLKALCALGAKPWPNPSDPAGFEEVLSGAFASPSPQLTQTDFFELGGEQSTSHSSEDSESGLAIGESAEGNSDAEIDYAEELYQNVHSWAPMIFAEPRTLATVAEQLKVTKPTADVWIKRLVADGVLVRQAKPVRYVVCQESLLENAPAGYSPSAADKN